MGNFLRNLHPLLRRDKNVKDNQDPNHALLDAMNSELEEVEQETIASKLQSSLKTATGEYLDNFGDWFGVYRKNNETDGKYRQRIIDYLLLKRGTNNSIIKAIKDYLDDQDTDVKIYEPFNNIFYTNKSHLNGEDHLMGYYYRFAVINVTIGSYFPTEVIDVINDFKPAGVVLYVTYDGASSIIGNPVIDWMGDLPKVEEYEEIDVFNGYGDIFYGHLNMRESTLSNKVSNVFKTNDSLINSLDVLVGSSNVGRMYSNYSYVSSYYYNPNLDSAVSNISSIIGDAGSEVDTDFYLYTNKKDNNKVSLNLDTEYGVSYIYNHFNFKDYITKYRPEVDLTTTESKQVVSDFIGELTIDYYVSATVPPDQSVDIETQVYDFSIQEWITVASNDVSFYEDNIGANIGYIKDYLNDNLNFFLRIEVNNDSDSVELKVNYLDLTFSHYKKDIYTIKPYKGLVYNYTDLLYEYYVEAFKVSNLNNGDIITKTGYQPIGYLRVTIPTNSVTNLTDYLNVIATDILGNVIEYSSYTGDGNSATFKFNDIKTNIANINVVTSLNTVTGAKLFYSYYGDTWTELTKLPTTLKKSSDDIVVNNLVQNNLIDLYGLQTIDYSSLTPMSSVVLKSIWTTKVGDITSQKGTLSNMPNGYFNATWQEIDMLSTVKVSTMNIIKDTIDGIFDNSSGQVIKMNNMFVTTYTTIDILSTTLTNYKELINLGSNRLISELKDELLTIDYYNVDNTTKVENYSELYTTNYIEDLRSSNVTTVGNVSITDSNKASILTTGSRINISFYTENGNALKPNTTYTLQSANKDNNIDWGVFYNKGKNTIAGYTANNTITFDTETKQDILIVIKGSSSNVQISDITLQEVPK